MSILSWIDFILVDFFLRTSSHNISPINPNYMYDLCFISFILSLVFCFFFKLSIKYFDAKSFMFFGVFGLLNPILFCLFKTS